MIDYLRPTPYLPEGDEFGQPPAIATRCERSKGPRPMKTDETDIVHRVASHEQRLAKLEATVERVEKMAQRAYELWRHAGRLFGLISAQAEQGSGPKRPGSL